MKELKYTLLADGGSDRALIYIIDWIFKQYTHHYSGQFADKAPPHGDGLYRRAQWALKFYPCDILFVHRDAENRDHDLRIEEIRRELSKIHNHYIPIVPVHMTEAWLLSSEAAIREAAGNPHGNQSLKLPLPSQWDKISNPKMVLFEALKTATGLQGRRLHKFNAQQIHQARLRVAQLTDDFSGLNILPAFQRLSQDIQRFLEN
jgi:hypothetical protein